MSDAALMFVVGEAAIGAVAGSTVTTAALRTARGQGWIGGRSRCDCCGCSLAFANTVPLVSFAFARGRCASCSAPICLEHPIGEALGIAIVWTAAASQPDWSGALLAATGLLFLYAAVFDIKTRRIPDWLSACVLALAISITWAEHTLLSGLVVGVGVFAALSLLRALFRRAKGRDGLGGGDIKLLAAASVWMGVERFGVALAIASLLALAWATSRRDAAPTAQIAFGPFIAGGCWVAGLWPSV